MDPINDERDDLLRRAKNAPPGSEVSLTIRALLGLWGAKRRGYWHVQRIKAGLEAAGLHTEPSFDEGWIDTVVRLVPDDRPDAVRTTPEDQPLGDAAPQPAADRRRWRAPESQETVSTNRAGSLALGDLINTHVPMPRCSPDDDLAKAQSLMMRHGTPFLAVMKGERSLEGVLTWASIAQAMIHGEDVQLRDCIEPANILDAGADLLENIPPVIEAGCVFARMPDKTIGGMVTTADLARAFQRLTAPFLLVGVAERLLRDAVEGNFTEQEISEATQFDQQNGVRLVDDLTFGELTRLFENRERWDRLDWRIDRVVFLDLLDAVRRFRNHVMHFRSDEPSLDSMSEVQYLIAWLRRING